MPRWVDEKYTKREVGWIRIDGEWRPTVVLDGIPVQVTVDPRIGVGPLAEAWGPRVAEPSVQPQELDERTEGIASCLGHIVFQHGGSADLAGALQKWLRDHLDAPEGVTSPTARQRAAQRFIVEQMPIIRAAARTLGYAIAIHGTLDRDVDLVAIPWTADAADADALAAAVRDAMGGAFATTTDGRVQTEACNRPHGRRTWAIGSTRLWGSYVDLSVMPRVDGTMPRYTIGTSNGVPVVIEHNRSAESTPRRAAEPRPHRLTWNGTEWVAPCGCRYHPDDDNGSHGGAPHVHRCEKHVRAAPEYIPSESEIRSRERTLADSANRPPDGTAPERAPTEEALRRLLDEELNVQRLSYGAWRVWDDSDAQLEGEGRTLVEALAEYDGARDEESDATRPPDGMPGDTDAQKVARVAALLQRYTEYGVAHALVGDLRRALTGDPNATSADGMPGEPAALLDALVSAAIGECERAVRQARTSETWETCFRAAFARILAAAPPTVPGEDGRLGVQPPIPMLLTCPQPNCGARHIDRGEFATKPHHTHTCQRCGHTWRPAKVHTVGVDFLPGYHDDDQRENDLRAELGKFCAMLENPDCQRTDGDDVPPETHIAEQLRRILDGDRDGAPTREEPCR